MSSNPEPVVHVHRLPDWARRWAFVLLWAGCAFVAGRSVGYQMGLRHGAHRVEVSADKINFQMRQLGVCHWAEVYRVLSGCDRRVGQQPGVVPGVDYNAHKEHP